MIVSTTYLMILLTFGIRLFRKILNKNQSKQINTEPLEIKKQDDYNAIFHKKNFLPVIGTFVLSILIAIISLFVSYLFTKGSNMIIIILLLTSLGIACSFIPKVRRVKKSFEAGMYLILIFSLFIASTANPISSNKMFLISVADRKIVL